MAPDDIITRISRIDYEHAAQKITGFLSDALSSSGAKGLVLGLSGGIDSAVLAHMCARAGKDCTLAMIMPDTDVSPAGETDDALRIVKDIQIQYKLVDIAPILREYSRYIEPDDAALGNLRARIRTNMLYYYANAQNRLVAGSSDKSEYLIGYFTKFGDGASDIMPIACLYKTQVRGMARHLGIPDSIIAKKSGAHLWKNHFAEEEIGADYVQIDQILYCMTGGMDAEQTVAATGIKKETVEMVRRMHENTAHKREAARVPDIS